MTAIPTRPLGRAGAAVSEIGLGGAPLGDLFEVISESTAQEILGAAWEQGVRYFDTAPFYGYGKSEHRVGHFLRQQERPQFACSTKVGRVLRAARDLSSFDSGFWAGGLPFELEFDYSYDGIMRSFEDSLQRLALPSVEYLIIHDLDFWFHLTEKKVQAYLDQLATSGWRALERLRASGVIKGVGAGINEMGMIPRFLEMVDLDFFLVALPYTLLDQEVLDVEFPRCEERGVRVVIGAVFASGILATGPIEGAKYKYAPAEAEVLERTHKIETVCSRHGTPLAAAALQFPLAHPIVSAIIPGALAPEHVQQNLKLYRHVIPVDLWSELKSEGLLREDAPTP
jgi:D-threo-aldose 1-dehydrogenase